MSNDLKAARKALADLLTGPEDNPTGLTVVTVVPKTFTPPIVWVAPATPYRQRGQSFGMKRINLIALCVGGMSTNDAAADATDDLAEQVANIIDDNGQVSPYFRLDPIGEMDQPRLYPSSQGQQMLGIAVNVFCEYVRG